MPASTTAFRRALAPAALLGAAALALSGCAGVGAASAEGDGVSVVATTTQVADFTREVAGEQASVTQLIQPGQSAHTFDPSAQQLRALGTADALVVSGAGLEEWLDDAIEASGFDGVLIDASEDIDLEGEAHDHEHEGDAHEGETDAAATPAPTESGDQGGDADDTTRILPETEKPEPTPGDDHAGEEHAEEEHADDHAEGDDHAHAEGDPHIWTDPVLAMGMVENIAHGLEELPGLDADAIAANEDAYLAQLEALDEWIHESIDQVPVDRRLLVANHDAFTYFTAAYDVTFVGAVIPSFDDNAEPSAADIDALVDSIRDTGATAVFSESSISPKAAETIAAEAGVEVYSGEDALYSDSLGAEGSDGDTYVKSQIHNVRQLVTSWGATPLDLPDTLQG